MCCKDEIKERFWVKFLGFFVCQSSITFLILVDSKDCDGDGLILGFVTFFWVLFLFIFIFLSLASCDLGM